MRRKTLLAVLFTLIGAFSVQATAQSPEAEEAQKLMKAAQEKGDWAAVVQHGVNVGALLAKAIASPKPEEVSDDNWKATQERLKAERVQAEYACLDAASKETDPAKRVKLLEQFTAAFEGGDYAKRSLVTLAGAYQQAGNSAKAVATAQKALEVDPDNEGLHLLVADNDLGAKRLASAVDHAHAALRAIGSKKKQDGYTDDAWSKYTKTIEGSAHSIAGMALMQQDKAEAAIADLKPAADQLAGNPPALAPVLYNLGFAYAKLKRTSEARAVLAKAVQISGPFQQLSKDLLVKITPK